MPQLRIGISGWRYRPWRGTFYPPGWPQKRELEYAARKLNTIEINGSFYSLQRPEYYGAWYEQTPRDFVFSVKGSRFITHMKRLTDIDVPLANFLASGVLCLKEKLGPILWQFPETFQYDPSRFERFFALLPRTTREAAELARRHDARLAGRSYTKADVNQAIRYAVEIRHPSFAQPPFLALLRKYQMAIACADTAGRWPFIEELTADFVYCRLHGAEELYVSGYTDEALDVWAQRVRGWQSEDESKKHRVGRRGQTASSRGRDVFFYFDNDAKVKAPFDAMNLGRRLGLYSSGEGGNSAAPEGAGEAARTQWPALRRRSSPAGAGKSKPSRNRSSSSR